MSDLIERLRRYYPARATNDGKRLCDQAADEIDRLRERLQRATSMPTATEAARNVALEAKVDSLRRELAEALAWIAKTPHAEDCDMAEPVYAVPRCTCGRDALLTHADQPEPQDAAKNDSNG